MPRRGDYKYGEPMNLCMNVYLTRTHKEILKAEAKKRGVTMSQVLNDYLEKIKKDQLNY